MKEFILWLLVVIVSIIIIAIIDVDDYFKTK